MEAVEIAAGVLEVADPPLGLGNHHVAVKGAAAMSDSRTLDVGADLGDDRGAKGHVWDEVAVHDVYLERVRAALRTREGR